MNERILNSSGSLGVAKTLRSNCEDIQLLVRKAKIRECCGEPPRPIRSYYAQDAQATIGFD